MSLHARKMIRDAVVALLIAADTVAHSNVFPTRKIPFRKHELPAIAVFTSGEHVDEDSQVTAPRELTRQLTVTIGCYVTMGDRVDDAMDAIALEIETAMHADPYLGGKAGDSILRETDFDYVMVGDQEAGLITLTYAVIYRTLAPEPPTGLDEFLSVDATAKPVGSTPTSPVVEDQFNVRSTP